MLNSLNKRIPTTKSILIIILTAIIAGSGILAYQYWWIPKEEAKMPEVKTPERSITTGVEKYLHKDAVLHGVEMPPEAEYHAISLEEAILSVAQYLEYKSVEDIKIYHVLWSVAPVGQFYIAGECNFSREEKDYSKFLASIRDGSKGKIGKPNLLFKGLNIWYSDPEPEIIYEPDPVLPRCEQPDDEFLGNYEVTAESYNVYSIFEIIEIQDETADWKTEGKKEITEEEKISLFTQIFPDEITGSDLDRIANINEKAKTYFQEPIHDDFKRTCWGSIEHVELDGKSDTELFVLSYCNESYIDLELPGDWPCFEETTLQHLKFKEVDYDKIIKLPQVWFPEEKNYPRWILNIEDLDEESNLYYDKLIIKFETTPNLFPSNETVAKENFEPLHRYDEENLTVSVRIYEDAKTVRLFGHDISPNWVEIWPVVPEFGPIYVFRWENKEWNPIGKVECGYRSWYKIREIEPGSFADIIVGHSMGAGAYSATRYQWDGEEYLVTEDTYCEYKEGEPKLCEEAMFGVE